MQNSTETNYCAKLIFDVRSVFTVVFFCGCLLLNILFWLFFFNYFSRKSNGNFVENRLYLFFFGRRNRYPLCDDLCSLSVEKRNEIFKFKKNRFDSKSRQDTPALFGEERRRIKIINSLKSLESSNYLSMWWWWSYHHRIKGTAPRHRSTLFNFEWNLWKSLSKEAQVQFGIINGIDACYIVIRDFPPIKLQEWIYLWRGNGSKMIVIASFCYSLLLLLLAFTLLVD